MAEIDTGADLGTKSSWALRVPHTEPSPPARASWADALPIQRDQYDDKSCGCWAGAYSAMTVMWVFRQHGLRPVDPEGTPGRAQARRTARSTAYPGAVAFSPSWIFNRLMRSQAWTSGADSVLALLRDVGTVQWWSHPVSVGEKLLQVRPDLEDLARDYRIGGFGFFERPHDARWQRSVKWWIANRSPVLFEILVTESFLRQPLTSDPETWVTGPPVDRHVVVCVGYDQNNFLLSNSWGRKWARQGIIAVPCDVAARMAGPGDLTWGILPSWRRDPEPVNSDVWEARMAP